MKIKKISLFVLFVLTLVSCSNGDKNQLVDFPLAIVSNDFPLGTDHIQGQTPIDIVTSSTVKMNSVDPVIHYSSVVLSNVQNTVENLKINLTDVDKAANYITIRGFKYELQQFHFHHHSEHSINGTYGVMEIHFVNKSATGAYAVLGVLVKDGAANSSLQTLIDDSPSASGSNIYGESMNLSSILPLETNKYYSYSGSLTTPNMDLTPNQGPLTWFVFKNNITMTAAQLEEYKVKYEEQNFRVIQPLNDRKIYENN